MRIVYWLLNLLHLVFGGMYWAKTASASLGGTMYVPGSTLATAVMVEMWRSLPIETWFMEMWWDWLGKGIEDIKKEYDKEKEKCRIHATMMMLLVIKSAVLYTIAVILALCKCVATVVVTPMVLRKGDKEDDDYTGEWYTWRTV